VSNVIDEMLSALSDSPGAPKAPNIIVALRDRSIEVSNHELCSDAGLRRLWGVGSQLLQDQIDRLPAGHAWRAKGKHGIETAEEALRSYRGLLDQMPERNVLLLLIVAALHDVGRPEQFLRGDVQDGKHHGHLSVDLLQEAGAFNELPNPTTDLVSYIIEHHADRSTPTLPRSAIRSERLAHVWTALIRDLDKVGLFRNKTQAYLYNEEEKERQEAVLRRINPDYRGEVGSIEAARYLVEFQDFQTLDRTELLTYEAYMLQYLAWIFDLNLRASVEAVVKCGAVHSLLIYFKDQVPDHYWAILSTTETYLARWDLSIT